MKLLIRFLKTAFLIGAHGVAAASVFVTVKMIIGNLPKPVPITYGAMTGLVILSLTAWWSFRNADPARHHRIGNILYRGGRVCAVLLGIAGVLFAAIYGVDNPFGKLVAPFMIVVFWFLALMCLAMARGFLFLFAGR